MLTFLEIAQRYRPRWVVWENVPGVLSSNGGRDFGAFLGALGELGYGWAYRVLDAQWFGVAQRRRRVFVVGCLGDQSSAAAVLFESESVSRNPPPRREARQGFARGVEGGVELCGPLNARDYKDPGTDGMNRNSAKMVPVPFAKTHKPMSETDPEGWSPVDASPTITHWPRDRSDGGTDVAVVQPVGTDCYNGAITGDVAATIGTPGSSVNASGPTVMQPVGSFKPGQSAAARGIGYETDLAPSLEGGGGGNNKPAVHVAMQVRRLTPVECSRLQGFPDTYLELTYGTESEAHASQVLHELWKQVGTIAREGWRSRIVASLLTPEVLLAGVHGGWISWQMAASCACSSGEVSSKVNYEEGFVRRLQEAGQNGCSPYQRESFRQLAEELGCPLSQLPLEEAQARKILLSSKLWPEAQRTWPLRYALATETQRRSGKLNADGPRYKALGNSMAVPCMRWIGERIAAATRQEVKP